MTSKRPHTKSRLGCKQCKGRRIRCDQTTPCCINCAKRGVDCEYQEWAQLLTPGGFGNSTLRSVSVSPSPDPSSSSSSSSSSSASFDLEDLGLLHHFTLYTSQTLGALESERYRHIWQHEVPKLAVTNTPLMHAILAFAAAHQASANDILSEPRSQMQSARHHYSKALVLFRSSVKELTAERADVMLCYCNLICFLTLFFGFDKPIDEQDPIDDFVGLLGILHSTIGILKLLEGSVRQSVVGELLQHKWEKQSHGVPAEVDASLNGLDVLVEQYRDQPGFDTATITCLRDAMLKLRHMFEHTEPHPDSWAHLLSWPIKLGLEFSKLVEQRHPAALCTLCHWLVPAHHAPRKWYVGDWPRRMVIAISEELGNYGPWETGFAWPRNEILK